VYLKGQKEKEREGSLGGSPPTSVRGWAGSGMKSFRQFSDRIRRGAEREKEKGPYILLLNQHILFTRTRRSGPEEDNQKKSSLPDREREEPQVRGRRKLEKESFRGSIPDPYSCH